MNNIGTDYSNFKLREDIGKFAFIGYFALGV